MRYFAKAAVVATLAGAAPASAGSGVIAVTPSGTAETVFRGLTPDKASGKLASQCITNGLTVIASTPSDVTCEIKMGTFKSALAQALIGNSYSTPPRNLVRFTLSPIGVHTRVQASHWLETQMALGQTRSEPISSDDNFNDLMGFMTQAGGDLPPGTRFPNHGYLGISFAGEGAAKFRGRYAKTVIIKDVESGGAGALGGVQSGDQLVAINGKTFGNLAEFAKRLRVPAGDVMDLSVVRGGQIVPLKVTAGRRPDIPMEDLAATTAAQPAIGATLPSVADELGKLADLKAKGVITQAEFDAQKAKLLAR